MNVWSRDWRRAGRARVRHQPAGYTACMPAPDGSRRFTDAGALGDLVGPLHLGRVHVLGVRVQERRLNGRGTAVGGFLATLVEEG